MADAQQKSYEVGYAKPPRHSRFQRGESGNPRGRPRGALNLSSRLMQALLESVTVSEHGVAKKMRKIDIAITQQTNKAAAGDAQALKLLTTLLREADRRETDGQNPITVVISKTDSEL
jgi:hypothetical protein